MDAIDLGQAWCLDPQVAIRPEPFGALAYHFGTRRLSFLKNRVLLDIVRSLEEHTTALEACHAAGVSNDELPRYEQALSVLASSMMIRPRA